MRRSSESSLSNDGSIRMRKEVSLIGGCAIIIGTMIGSGIFISPYGVLQMAGSTGLSLLIWFLSGVISTLGALCYAELGVLIPKSGGEFAYLHTVFSPMNNFFGPLPSYLFAWCTLLAIKTAALAVITMTLSEYFLSLIILNPSMVHPMLVKLVAILFLILLGSINCYSVALASKVQTSFTAAKLLAIFCIIACGVFKLSQGYTQNLTSIWYGSKLNPSNLALSFYSGLWAYDGWNSLNFLTEEVKNPAKKIPLAISIALPLVTLLYLLTNISYMIVLSSDQILSSQAVAVEWSLNLLGPSFYWLIPLSVSFSAFGAANGELLAASRVVYSAAREGQLPYIFSTIHMNKLTPVASIICTLLISILMVLSGSILSLIDFFSFIVWIFYALTMIALLILKQRTKKTNKAYSVPAIIPIIMLLVSIFLIVAPIVHEFSLKFLYAFSFIFIGFLIYIPFVYLKLHLAFIDNVNYALQIILNSISQSPERFEAYGEN